MASGSVKALSSCSWNYRLSGLGGTPGFIMPQNLSSNRQLWEKGEEGGLRTNSPATGASLPPLSILPFHSLTHQGASGRGSASDGPQAKSSPAPAFPSPSSLQQRPICLHAICGCFHPTTAVLIKTVWPSKLHLLYSLVLYSKSINPWAREHLIHLTTGRCCISQPPSCMKPPCPTGLHTPQHR